MGARVTAKVEGLSAALDAVRVKQIMARLKGITRAQDTLKSALREQTEAGGLGERLAKTWQGKVYKNDGTNPATLVYTKAPKIIDAYARGATIVATAGRRLLAIPTDQAPRKKAGGAALAPHEVEARFGRKLRFVPARSSAGFRVKSRGGAAPAVGYLVMDGLVTGDRSGRVRNASPRQLRVAGTGKAKAVQGIVMFALVPRVKKPKLFDLEALAESVGATVPQLIAEEWEA